MLKTEMLKLGQALRSADLRSGVFVAFFNTAGSEAGAPGLA